MENQHFPLSEKQAAGLKTLVAALQEDNSWIESVKSLVSSGDFGEGLVPADDEWATSLEESFSRLSEAVERKDLGGHLNSQRQRTAEMAAAGMPLRPIARTTTDLRDPLAEHVRRVVSDGQERAAAVDALDLLLRESLVIAGEVYASEREDQLEDDFHQTIRRLSTPVIQVWDGIQVLPLIGVIDSTRAQEMTERLLERIVERQARVVIIDITGVPTVDTAVADHLLKTTKAASLVGARTILVGISPPVAQTLVRLGVSLGDIETYSDLRSGLEYALGSLGYVIERRSV